MADMQVSSDLRVDQWSKKLYFEYVRDNKLRKLMGRSPNAPIQLVTELKKEPGDDIWVPFIDKIEGDGKTGDDTLEGSEVTLGNHGHKVTIDQIRQAVRRGRMEQQKTFFDMLEAARPMLKKWAMNKMRSDIITAMYSANVDGSTAYASCTEAQKDAFLDYNYDRILFGAAKSNLSTSAPAGGATYDHSGSLGAIDSTTGVLTPGQISLLKRMMKTPAAYHNITPTNVNDQGEWFVLLCGPYPFRDLKNNSTITNAHQYARERGKNNPLFTDGDLMWDGVIIKEIEEIPVVSGVGASSIDVSANFMLGAQAVAVATGEELHGIEQSRDYGNLRGRGVAEIRGIDKLMRDSTMNGMGILWTAAVADS